MARKPKAKPVDDTQKERYDSGLQPTLFGSEAWQEQEVGQGAAEGVAPESEGPRHSTGVDPPTPLTTVRSRRVRLQRIAELLVVAMRTSKVTKRKGR